MKERWKDVPDYEGHYQASNLGRIKSVDRYAKTAIGRRVCRGVVMTLVANPRNGYLYCGLSKNGNVEMRSVHYWVTLTWLGVCPEGMEICHGPSGKKNNKLPNLRYGSRSSNHRDKHRDGTAGKSVIRSDGREFDTMTLAANETGCPLSSISSACSGRLKNAGGFSWRKL